MAPRKPPPRRQHAPEVRDERALRGEELMAYLFEVNEMLLRNDEDDKRSNRIRYICTVCKSRLLRNKCEYVCSKCGTIFEEAGRNMLDSYESRQNVVPKYEYQRVTHFKDCLTQKQSAEHTDIPDTLLEHLEREFAKHRYDKESVTFPMVKALLNKIKKTQYYEHTSLIVCHFTGEQVFSIEPQVEQQLMHLFSLIQEPFERCKPADRKNFLSYPYCLHKMFLLLGMEEHAQHFDLLKSREKLKIQDKIWKEICDHLGFTFFPSY